jgi:osmotically-inducible protein OsmY
MNDSRLKQYVADELARRPYIDSAHIEVTADHGIVSLKGEVPSYAEKYVAEQAVKRLEGVRGVVENLQVRLPGVAPAKDEETARRALNALPWDTVIPRDSIKVTVKGGYVTLSGEVSWRFQKIAAKSAMRRLDGVVGVIDNISLKRRNLTLKSRIQSVLRRHAQLDSDAIRARASGGMATLEGEVDS